MKKGLKTLIAGIVIFLIGAVALPVFFVFTLLTEGMAGQQFIVPGSAEIQIEKSGRYYLWNDYQTVYEGATYNASLTVPGGLSIRFTDAGGEPLPLSADTAMSINIGGSSKNSIGFIEVTEPGNITVNVSGELENRVFSVSAFSLAGFVRMILSGLILAFAGIAILIWGIVKLVKNSRGAAKQDAA